MHILYGSKHDANNRFVVSRALRQRQRALERASDLISCLAHRAARAPLLVAAALPSALSI